MGSSPLESEGLSAQTGLPLKASCTALCTNQIETAAAALREGDAIFCCTQESRRFEALADEYGVEPPAMVDLRDRAGWSEDTASKLPKMSALLAEATLPSAATKTLDVVSEGLCLIIGPADVALEAAVQLKDFLGVTVLLDRSDALDRKSVV